jgi:SPP1 family predicted phage head-tail adaptor
MQIGKLRHLVSIERRVETLDDVGDAVPRWQSVARVWGAVEPLSGRELVLAQQIHAEATTRIRLRHRFAGNPREKMRIVHRERLYNIKASMNQDTRDLETVLLCTDGVNDG